MDEYIGKDRVIFLTNEGRVLRGRLEGYDKIGNVVISDCHEENVRHGVVVLRGDNLSLIGETLSIEQRK
jgi:small nuclear ribonucleoprotein (snRNP)-like protein